MPAAIPYVAIALATAGMVESAVQANDSRQQAKGLAETQTRLMQEQTDTAKKQDEATQQQKAQAGSATQAAALAALRASMSASSGMGGSILTGPQGAAPAPIQGKVLLGQ